jgi:predicted Zn-dependent protease
VSDQVLTQQSLEVFSEMRQKIPVVKDEAIRRRVLEIGQKVALASGGNLDWEFEVFDSPEVNAFCLPGGKIGIFSGILPIAKTNGGLAAIIGHEVAHALAHHSAERASQALILGQVVAVVDDQLEGKKGKEVVVGALNIGAQLGLLLPFSRRHETEADAIGIDYMARAGFDPREAVALWQRMAAAESNRSPEWLGTHPNPSRRIKDLEALLPHARTLYQASHQQYPTEVVF